MKKIVLAVVYCSAFLAAPLHAQSAAKDYLLNEAEEASQEEALRDRQSDRLKAGAYTGAIATDKYGFASVSGLRGLYQVNSLLTFEVAAGRTQFFFAGEDIDETNKVTRATRETVGYLTGLAHFSLMSGILYAGPIQVPWVLPPTRVGLDTDFKFLLGAGMIEIFDDERPTIVSGLGATMRVNSWLEFESSFKAYVAEHGAEANLAPQRDYTKSFELTFGVNFGWPR